MATATLVAGGAQRLRYLIAGTGTTAETVFIGTVGGATPDTLTDSTGPGVIKQLSGVVANGYGQFAAGVQTQAKARALWLSDWSGADPGNENNATAVCRITARTVGAGVDLFSVDADVSAGNPRIAATISGGGSAYLDIESPGTIGT